MSEHPSLEPLEIYTEFGPGTVITVLEGGLLRISNQPGRTFMERCHIKYPPGETFCGVVHHWGKL